MTVWRTVYDQRGDAEVTAGEVAVMEIELQKPDGAGGWADQPLVNREFVQWIMDDDGDVVTSAVGQVLTAEDGSPIVKFVIPGEDTAEALPAGSKRRRLRHEVAEILAEGRDTITIGAFVILAGARPNSNPSPAVGHNAPAARFTVRQGGNRVIVRYVGAPGLDGEDGDPGGPPGPTGPAGPQGVQGVAGPQGATGLAGPPGPTGAQGIQGQQGVPGPQGAQGPTGAPGAQGPQGIAGPTGPEGDPGPAGPQGVEGPAGPEGPQGDAGPQGPEGPDGPQGPPGAGIFIKGSKADPSDLAAEVATAEPGDAYLIDGDLWVFDGVEFDNVGNIQGPQGLTGPQGIQGVQGIQGAPGATGPAGSQGPAGPQGIQGAQGIQGDPGVAGPEGPEGPQGIQGVPGADGAQGPEGPTGPQGDVGPAGPTGPAGATDADGVTYDDTLTAIGAAVGYPVTNVQEALAALYTLIQAGGIVGAGVLDLNNPEALAILPALH